MNRPLYLLLLLLTACTLQNEPSTEGSSPDLSLSASVTEGVAPLEVIFSAQLMPTSATASTYTWTLAGQTLSETTSALTHTFDAPGVYVVTAKAETRSGSAADSVTVSVTQGNVPPEEPGEPVGEGTLGVTKTPGGPAPWAVRYTVRAEGYGDDAQVSVRCSAEGDSGYVFGDEVTEGAVCLHTTAAEQVQVDVLVGDEVVDTVTVASEVTPPREEVAFLGTWRYEQRGQRETFSITRGTPTAGESEAGFELFLIELDGRSVAEFTFGGRTVVLDPTPETDGRQVYFADVYGLRLERLD